MRLREVPGVEEILKDSRVSADPIWERPLDRVSENEIILFYARAGLCGLRNDAIDAIERVQSAVIVAAFHGEKSAGVSAIITHVPPVAPFLVDEFVVGLSQLSIPRRRACLYALEMKISPAQATTLCWADLPSPAQRQAFPKLAREVLDECAKTRHIRLPYVFWEWATNRIAAPLMEMQSTIELAFSCPWPELVEKHSRMIQLNRSADSASFLQLAEEVRSGRL